MILLGVGAAVAVTRNQEADRRATAASGSNGASDAATPTTEGSGSRGPTLAEIAASDITGTWAMQLVVIESTGFFGTQVGTSVDKTYTITSDCSKTPCAFKLGVSGTPGEFALRREADDYILSEAGPNDCIDLPTGAIKVPRGGVATVVVHLRPTAATRTLRGDWTASGLLGSVLTTFDTTDPGCVQGSGRQRSTAVGTRP